MQSRRRMLKLWRLALMLGEQLDGSLQDRRLVWRRRFWRVWTGDVMTYNRSSLRKWATWRLGQGLAGHALLRFGVVAACDAMRTLNRAAKHGAQEQHEIYALKRRLIGELLESFPCAITKHVQEQPCYSCDGTGTWSRWASYAETCLKCRGTGVFRRTELLLFAFTVHGREYRWHQPADFWPHLDVAESDGIYEPERSRAVYVGDGLRYETLIETVARWIDGQGLSLGGMTARGRRHSFAWCVEADWKALKHNIARRIHAATATPTADDSDLPF